MGTRKVEQGAVGQRVAAQVREHREKRKLSLETLSTKLSDLGRPILASGLSKIEAGDRRVDVDDLVALATALGTEPSFLLEEPAADAEITAAITSADSLTVDLVAESASPTDHLSTASGSAFSSGSVTSTVSTSWAVRELSAARRLDEAMEALQEARQLLSFRLRHRLNSGDTVAFAATSHRPASTEVVSKNGLYEIDREAATIHEVKDEAGEGSP